MQPIVVVHAAGIVDLAAAIADLAAEIADLAAAAIADLAAAAIVDLAVATSSQSIEERKRFVGRKSMMMDRLYRLNRELNVWQSVRNKNRLEQIG